MFELFKHGPQVIVKLTKDGLQVIFKLTKLRSALIEHNNNLVCRSFEAAREAVSSANLSTIT